MLYSLSCTMVDKNKIVTRWSQISRELSRKKTMFSLSFSSLIKEVKVRVVHVALPQKNYLVIKDLELKQSLQHFRSLFTSAINHIAQRYQEVFLSLLLTDLAITEVPNAFQVQKLKTSVCRKVCFRFYLLNCNILTYY